MKRITKLCESPCYQCPVASDCTNKRMKNFKFDEIYGMVWSNAEYKRKDCPLYIALTANIIEVDE